MDLDEARGDAAGYRGDCPIDLLQELLIVHDWLPFQSGGIALGVVVYDAIMS